MKQDRLVWYAWYLNVDKCLELALQHMRLVIMVTGHTAAHVQVFTVEGSEVRQDGPSCLVCLLS